MSFLSGLFGAIAGAAEIALGVLIEVGTLGGGTPLAVMLIASGAGMVISGIGTMLSSGGAVKGYNTTERNSVAPWKVCYGRNRVGGSLAYLNQWGSNNQMLDMVIILADHACQSVDGLYLDQNFVQIDNTAIPTTAKAGYSIPAPCAGSGSSFTPVEQTVNIQSIARDANGVVTVQLQANIPYLTEGSQIQIQNVTFDQSLNGIFEVTEIVSQTFGSPGSITFSYLSGGSVVALGVEGQAKTLWINYGRNVYVEYLLGAQTLGETFLGLTAGTPYQGTGKLVTPQSPGPAGGSASSNQWTANCSLQGKTAAFVRLQYDSTLFAKGLPQISFHLSGKNDIFDPRTSTNGYTENAALCIADYLSNSTFGYSAAYSTEIPSAPLIAAANVCDQNVTLASGGTEPRYACNGQFDLSMKRGEVLQNLLTSCAGRLAFYEGQYFIQPAAWNTPITTPVDLQSLSVGPMKWRPTVTINNLYNGVRGTYISPNHLWQSTDFPYYAQDTIHGYSGSPTYGGDINLEADGGQRRWLDIQLPFTISASMAQRIAKIELLRRRHQGTGTFILNMAGWQYVPLDVIQADCSYFGWTNKELEIAATRLRVDKQNVNGQEVVALSCELDLQETDNSIYVWSIDEELTPYGYQQVLIPGTTIVEKYPFPWSPGYVSPLSGDVYEQKMGASFGIQPVYYSDELQGTLDCSLEIKGTPPINAVSEVASPLVTCVPSDTGGNLITGSYVVALSARDAGSAPYSNTEYLNFVHVDIDPSVTTGSIVCSFTWGSGDDGGDLYIGTFDPDGFVMHHNQIIASAATTATITAFNQTTAGGPDPKFDHFGVIWQEIIHSGVWAQQCVSVTPTTITIGDPNNLMTTNQWAGYTLSLLAKYNPSVDIPILNMPVVSSTAATGGFFTVTIGSNALSNQLPDLTTLLSPDDLVVMRFNPTFTATSFTDANIANSYYPSGASGVEAGHVAICLSGVNAGDVRTIAGVSGTNDTEINIASAWAITPTTGDLVIICAPSTNNQFLTSPVQIRNGSVGSSIIAEPDVQNLADSVWLFRVRTEDVNNNFGLDSVTPFREVYLFGAGGTRTITSTQTMLQTDGRLFCDSSGGSFTLTLLPQSQLVGQVILIQKISSDTNTVTINCAIGDTFTDGTTGYTLVNKGDGFQLKF